MDAFSSFINSYMKTMNVYLNKGTSRKELENMNENIYLMGKFVLGIQQNNYENKRILDRVHDDYKVLIGLYK